MILGENGEKMSKSRGNVINPDEIVEEIGADAFRVYEMFMGAFDQPIPWSTNGARGCRRFLERVWRLQEIVTAEDGYSAELKSAVHETIKKVTEDYEKMKFNTAIAAMMALINTISNEGKLSRGDYKALLLLLNPVAPHISEEIWERMKFDSKPIYLQKWPQYDENAIFKATVELAVQINGKVKSRIILPSGLDDAAAEKAVLEDETVKSLIEGKTVIKVIVVKNKLINIVVR
jgi:leucyl-tRNA synthetase